MAEQMNDKNDFSDPKLRELNSASPSSSDKGEEISGGNEDLTWTEEEEKKIRRKLDFHVVPLVTLLYLLCFLDRANVGGYTCSLYIKRA